MKQLQVDVIGSIQTSFAGCLAHRENLYTFNGRPANRAAFLRLGNKFSMAPPAPARPERKVKHAKIGKKTDRGGS